MTQQMPSYPDEADVRAVCDSVTSAFLAFEPIEPAQLEVGQLTNRPDIMTGCVMMGGAFDGAVRVRGNGALARHVAESIFGDADGPLSEVDVRDAWAELTNIVGGNIKSLFSTLHGSICRLTLPVVAEGAITIPGSTLLYEIACHCGSQRLEIAVFKTPPSPRPDGQPSAQRRTP